MRKLLVVFTCIMLLLAGVSTYAQKELSTKTAIAVGVVDSFRTEGYNMIYAIVCVGDSVDTLTFALEGCARPGTERWTNIDTNDDDISLIPDGTTDSYATIVKARVYVPWIRWNIKSIVNEDSVSVAADSTVTFYTYLFNE